MVRRGGPVGVVEATVGERGRIMRVLLKRSWHLAIVVTCYLAKTKNSKHMCFGTATVKTTKGARLTEVDELKVALGGRFAFAQALVFSTGGRARASARSSR